MVRKYVHLSGRDSDTAVLKLYGLAKKEDEISRLTPTVCRVCGFENAGKVSYCERCARSMSTKAAAQERAIEDERLLGAFEKSVNMDKFKKELKQSIMKGMLKELKKEEILEAIK
jgi:predicted Zn-ribbon and HTH transcriptional regulator